MFLYNALKTSLWGDSDSKTGNELISIKGSFWKKVDDQWIEIFSIAEATIRKTPMMFCSQLAVMNSSEANTIHEFERVFLLSADMKFSGDGDSFYWMSTSNEIHRFTYGQMDYLVNVFMLKCCQSIYEHKFKKDGGDMNEDTLSQYCPFLEERNWTNENDQFAFKPQENITPKRLKIESDSTSPAFKTENIKQVREQKEEEYIEISDSESTLEVYNPNIDLVANEEEELFLLGEEIVSIEGALLHMDLTRKDFVLLQDNIVLQINDTSQYNEDKEFSYDIYVFEDVSERVILKSPVNSTMNPQFIENDGECAFMWASTTVKQSQVYSVKFLSPEDFVLFKKELVDCLWESNTQKSISTLDKEDRKWIFGAYEQNPDYVEEDDGYIEDDLYDYSTSEESVSDSDHSESDSYDEEFAQRVEEKNEFFKDRNSMLNVGRKSDRSFVVRGDQIGVFKTFDNEIEYQTTISAITTPSKKTFTPKKAMLHEEDNSILLLDKSSRHKNKVFKMDLERGEVVEEWDAGPMHIDNLVPETKVAQRTPVKSVLGLNKGGFFMLDPRLSGSKLVQKSTFQYKDPRQTKFECATTTRDGHLAVGSETGEIRMYSRQSLYSKHDPMGLFNAPRSKTNLPGLGDAIIGLDVTFDGKWILASCKSYLLVIPTSLDEDSTGFQKPMGKLKPVPRLLKLKDEHMALVGKVSFTPAKFNYGYGLETTIATSTGPFVITWNFRKIKQNKLHEYQIKKYGDVIVADDFSFDNDKTVVVTMPDNVKVASRKKNV